MPLRVGKIDDGATAEDARGDEPGVQVGVLLSTSDATDRERNKNIRVAPILYYKGWVSVGTD